MLDEEDRRQLQYKREQSDIHKKTASYQGKFYLCLGLCINVQTIQF